MKKTNAIYHHTDGKRRDASERPAEDAARALLATLVASLAGDPGLLEAVSNLVRDGGRCTSSQAPRPARVALPARGAVQAPGATSYSAAQERPTYDRMMRLPEVLHVTGLRRSTLYEKIAKGLFPQQVPLGANMVGWYESEVLKWLRNPM